MVIKEWVSNGILLPKTAMEQLRLTVNLEGPAVTAGEIELRRLTQFGDLFQRLLDRVASTYLGQEDGYDEVKPTRQETSLRVVSVEKGSFILGLELQSRDQLGFFDVGPKALEALVTGLESIHQDRPDLPQGYDQTVLSFWRDIGSKVLKNDIERIGLELASSTGIVRQVTYDYNLYQKVVNRIIPLRTKKIVLKGRLMIVNFKDDSRRCRLYLDGGGYVSCVFNTEIAPRIQEAMRHYVRIWGTSKVDATTKRIGELEVQGVTILIKAEDEIDAVQDPMDVADETIEYADFDELEEISDNLLLKNFDLYRRLAQ